MNKDLFHFLKVSLKKDMMHIAVRSNRSNPLHDI